MPNVLPPVTALAGAIQQLANVGNAATRFVLTYEVELITPMMGGGTVAGTSDVALPFRTRALRGQLRMWWRMLARSGALTCLPVPLPTTPANWRETERSVWGGIAEAGSDESQ